MSNFMKYLKIFAKYIALIFFIAVIFQKFFASMIPVKYGALSDNRMPARFPQNLTLNFPKEFDAYYQDNFPRRKKLIKRYNKTRKKRFGINDYIITGKEDWMYYNSVKSEIKSDQVADYLGTNLYSDEYLKEIIDILFKDIEKFESLGAKVIVAFPPNKMKIYPEYLPDIYQGKQAKFTRTQQIAQEIRARGREVIEFDDVLLAAKDKNRVFWRTDTHWNTYGGYLAYRKIFDKIKNMGYLENQVPLELLNMPKKERACGDNFKTEDAGISCKDWDYDLEVSPTRKHKCQMRGLHPEMNFGVDNILCTSEGKKQKLLVIRDSFFDNIYPMLTEHFEQTTLLWRNLLSYPEMTKIIKETKPDLVILEYQERFSFYVADTIFQE